MKIPSAAARKSKVFFIKLLSFFEQCAYLRPRPLVWLNRDHYALLGKILRRCVTKVFWKLG